MHSTAHYKLFAVLANALGVAHVYAQGTTPAPTPAAPDLSTLLILLQFLAQTLRITAYGLGVAMVIYAGILYLTAYGDEAKPTQAKNIIRGVAIGLCFVVLAEVIILALLRGVEPEANTTGQFNAIQSVFQ